MTDGVSTFRLLISLPYTFALKHWGIVTSLGVLKKCSGTGLEQIYSYFKLELSGESLKKVIEVMSCDIRRQGYTIQMVLAEFSFSRGKKTNNKNKQTKNPQNKMRPANLLTKLRDCFSPPTHFFMSV